MNVSILGAGAMGSAMATNLAGKGFDVRIWDRTPGRADPLRGNGVRPVRDLAEAVGDADVAITMLADGPAVLATMERALPALRAGAVWLQMSTIGVPATTEAIALAKRRSDVTFVDAPVSGSTAPARAGTLTILASGPKPAVDNLQALFAALGQKTVWLGDAGVGSRMKLVLNALLAALVEGTAEIAVLARTLGVPLDRVSECVQGGGLDAPLVRSKLGHIAAGAFEPEFSLAMAAKDVRLALQAEAQDGRALPALEALDSVWQRALAQGYGDRDVSVVYLALEPAAAAAAPRETVATAG
jgi:3-hydroxyisobutyrate dehydrogenase